MGLCLECNKGPLDEGNLNSENQVKQTGPQMKREVKIKKLCCTERVESVNKTESNSSELETIKTLNFSEPKIPLQVPKVPNEKIPNSVINSAKKLKLIIIQSKFLGEGKTLIINAGGLVGSQRNAKDGITIFGDICVSNLLINRNCF